MGTPHQIEGPCTDIWPSSAKHTWMPAQQDPADIASGASSATALPAAVQKQKQRWDKVWRSMLMTAQSRSQILDADVQPRQERIMPEDCSCKSAIRRCTHRMLDRYRAIRLYL